MPAAESSKIQEKILTEQYSGGIMAVHETSWRLVGTVLETSGDSLGDQLGQFPGAADGKKRESGIIRGIGGHVL